jgi:hypothetical protein
MKKLRAYARFEVLTEVVMKSTIFWEITPCSWESLDMSPNRYVRESISFA